MKDLKGKFYTDSCIDDAFFREKEQVHYGKHDGQIMPCWIVYVKSF